MYYYYSLDMVGLGEHVEGVDGFDFITLLSETFEVAGEGAGVAADVDDVLGSQFYQCIQRFGVQTGAGWVE